MDAPSEEFPFLSGTWKEVRRETSEKVESLEEGVERRWIACAAAGDDVAFERLVRFHQDSVYRFCLRWLRDAHEAQDAAQDVFVRAYGAIGSFVPRARFSTWLYRIAWNLCRDRVKSKAGKQRSRTDSLDARAGDLVCDRLRPDESSAESDEGRKLWRGIEALPERLRVVVILCGIEGLDQEECAEILRCSVRAVEGRYYRARRELAGWWESQE